MQRGVHLRWSFLAALGFPPGGFWLCRRAAKKGEDRLPLPPTEGCSQLDVTAVYDYGGAGDPPCPRAPEWGEANDHGWARWGVPFTLPVTVSTWPARYFGAPDPTVTSPFVVTKHDISEAERRLAPLRLAAGMTAAGEASALAELRTELVRLVKAFPATSLAVVPIPDSPAGANAPTLNISVMQQLLLLALDPYFARVLGLYFVDNHVSPGDLYDYAVVGYWGATSCQNSVIYPGLAPAAPLARGSVTFEGLTITPGSGNTSLWRWTKFDNNGNYQPQLDPSSPPVTAGAVSGSLSGLTEAEKPAALLIAVTPGNGFFMAAPPQVTITLSQPVARIDIQVSGIGLVSAQSNGTVIDTASFNAAQMDTVSVMAANPTLLIDTITIAGTPVVAPEGIAVVVGSVTLHPITPDEIGVRYAIIGPPGVIQPIAAPGQPITTFRHRHADIDTTALKLVPHSLFDVSWPAQPVTTAQQKGDPVSDPLALPPPSRPLGFVAEREDSGVAGSEQRIPGWIGTRSVPTPANSSIPTASLYRLVDSQRLDPVGGWSHRVAAFDLFGVLGQWSAWSAPRKVEKIAAAPTAMRILQFDNSTASGGAPAADGSAWIGGTLKLVVNWSGASFMMYPDIVTARVTVVSIDSSGAVIAQLTTSDIDVPAATIQALTVTSVVKTPSSDGRSFTVAIQTDPPLGNVGQFAPSQVLMLTLADGSSVRYTVRPASGVATVAAGNAARIVTSTSEFVGQPAYLVCGYLATQVVHSVRVPSLSMAVPLPIPLAQDTARARVSVTGSTQSPYLVNETIVDPNGVLAPRPEPESVQLIFTAPQRLSPPVPATPVHQVDHVYYDPADATGRAGTTLPFTTPPAPGILGYVLQRAPVRSLAIADVKRRIGLNNAADNNPVVLDNGTPRADLAAWISSLATWVNCYNALNGTGWTLATVLNDATAQGAFIEHFYGGLLDDELRALGDLAGNAIGYARVNPVQIDPGVPISDTVDGTGYGRTLYRLAAVNHAGSLSDTTGSIGPYYTQIVTPPRAPVLYKAQPTQSSVIVAWAIDTNPDVAGYMVYRAANPDALADLRYFGADWANPAASDLLPSVQRNTTSYPPLSFVQAAPPNIDSRIVGFVPDPRLCARDYDGSDMGEIALPPGPAPDLVNGIYRLSEYQATAGPLAQAAFNYWTPPTAGGIAEIAVDTPTRTRLTGLRIGLGRGVPVVVVGTWNGIVKVAGQVPVRRAGFVDGFAGGAPLDPNTVADATSPATGGLNAYVIVAVDIFGNRSAPSAAVAAQMLASV